MQPALGEALSSSPIGSVLVVSLFERGHRRAGPTHSGERLEEMSALVVAVMSALGFRIYSVSIDDWP
jgi:hypothetical protein